MQILNQKYLSIIISHHDLNKIDSGGKIRTTFFVELISTYFKTLIFTPSDKNIDKNVIKQENLTKILKVTPGNQFKHKKKNENKLKQQVLNIVLFIKYGRLLNKTIKGKKIFIFADHAWKIPHSLILYHFLKKKNKVKLIYLSHNFEIKRAIKLKDIFKLFYAILSELIILPLYIDWIILPTNEGKTLFKDIFKKKVIIIPNSVKKPQRKIKKELNNEELKIIEEIQHLKKQYKIVGFIGDLNYKPNKEAIKHIMSVSKHLIDKKIMFVIVGKGIPRKKINNIYFLGFINNVNEVMKNWDVACFPLPYGGGSSIKTIHSLMLNIPIVGTYVTFRGIPVNKLLKEGCIYITDINNLKCKILEALESDNTKNCAKIISEYYDWNKLIERSYKIFITKIKEE